MEEKQRFVSFYEAYQDDFYDLFSNVRVYLQKNNSKYKKTYQEMKSILDNNLNVQKLIDENILENGLGTEECKEISKLIHLNYDLEDIYEREVYFKGGMDAYYYFKKIGIIK